MRCPSGLFGRHRDDHLGGSQLNQTQSVADLDDLDRADAHGDLVDGAPLTLVSQKLRAGFEKYGLRRVGEVGETFDPKLHEAIVQVYSKDVSVNTIADVIEPGYALGERLLRPAKVAVSVPAE